jgi:outer membrane protein assembly factor BamB
MRALLTALAGCVVILAAMAAAAQSDSADPANTDWSQWGGGHRNGSMADPSGYDGAWSPEKLWSKNVGKGCTSPIIADGKVYVMGWHGRGDKGTDVVTCFDGRTGKELWKQSYTCRYQGRVRTGDTGWYGGPNATPLLDRKTSRLYTLSIDGDLRCWDVAKAGKPVWSRNLYADYKVPQRPDVGGGRRDFGFTSSPLLLGDTIVVEVGEKAGTVMAFDAKTGKRRWRSEYKGPAGHTGGPVPITVDGKPCLVVLALKKLVVMRADKGHEGKTVAEAPWQTRFSCNIATPAVVGNRVIVTSGYNQKKTTLFEVSGGKIREIWSSRDHALVTSPVVHKGRVYLAEGTLKCLDLKTGKRLWRGGKLKHGSCLVTADDKLVALGSGRLSLVEAAPGARKYKELGHVSKVVPDLCFPHVAMAGGLVACKDRAGNLAVFSVGK